MNKTSQDMLVGEIADWRHRGLITGEQQAKLTARYDTPGSFSAILLQWLGLGAIFLLGLGILGLIGLMAQSLILGAVMTGGAAIACWLWGVKMATDPLQRHPWSGSVLVTVSLLLAFTSLVLVTTTAKSIDQPPLAPILVIIAALSFATAYWHRLRWPMLIGLLCLFHAVGSSHAYGGRGTYFADIQDPRLMAPVAAIIAVFGLWHQHEEQHKLAPWLGFGRLYVIFGLLYANASLLFLSIGARWSGLDNAVMWVVIFTLACIAQIVAGARLADAKLTGFGVVFLSINLYTRFFENFWDRLSAGSFFLIAGIIGLALGFGFEILNRRANTANPEGAA